MTDCEREKKCVKAEKRDRNAEREKETFRRQRHHQSERSWAVCSLGSLDASEFHVSSEPISLHQDARRQSLPVWPPTLVRY